jgi:hypothetical protein
VKQSGAEIFANDFYQFTRILWAPHFHHFTPKVSHTFTEPSPYAGPVGRWCGFSIFIIGENRTVFVFGVALIFTSFCFDCLVEVVTQCRMCLIDA